MILDLGNRKVLVRNFDEDHSAGDLVIYDYNSKIYFVGDIIFRQRTATFSDAKIKNWRNNIEFFSKKNFWNFILPGNGSVIAKHIDIDTAEWLKSLHKNQAIKMKILQAKLHNTKFLKVLQI